MREELKKLLPEGKKHFTARIGGFTTKRNFLNVEEISSLILYELKNNKDEIVIDHVYIDKTKATKLLFDIALKYSLDPVISFYARIAYKKSKYGVMSYLKNISGVTIELPMVLDH